jgi:hypothetical protein
MVCQCAYDFAACSTQGTHDKCHETKYWLETTCEAWTQTKNYVKIGLKREVQHSTFWRAGPPSKDCFISYKLCTVWVRTDQTIHFMTTKEQVIPVCHTTRTYRLCKSPRSESRIWVNFAYNYTFCYKYCSYFTQLRELSMLLNISDIRNKWHPNIRQKCLSECDVV